ncbi:MAG: hypothetical protein DWI02_00165 [Planctomycetota bacterium]|nr:MAG: hypothetical protein DWI02_00165 [Planctomycetota bacterium]
MNPRLLGLANSDQRLGGTSAMVMLVWFLGQPPSVFWPFICRWRPRQTLVDRRQPCREFWSISVNRAWSGKLRATEGTRGNTGVCVAFPQLKLRFVVKLVTLNG